MSDLDPDGLTDRQRRLFLYLYSSARDRGYQPSLREAGEHLGCTTSNGPVCHLKGLAAKGWIGQGVGRGVARSIVFLRRPDGSPFAGFSDVPPLKTEA